MEEPVLSAGSEAHLCKQCQAPINETCQCPVCRVLTGIEGLSAGTGSFVISVQ